MRCAVVFALMPLFTGAAWAQAALAARAGLIHYVQGDVFVDGRRIDPKPAEFPLLERNELLSTGLGRAEILLNPGTFLRLGENSSFRLLSASLTDTRLALVSGQALIEVEDLRKDNALTVTFMNTDVAIAKRGLYQFDADRGLLRVYDGEASVSSSAAPLKVKKAWSADLNGPALAAAKFDRSETDTLYRWSARRARYIARANASSARAAGRNRSYGWSFNPVYGMFSFLPRSGYPYSPFGITVTAPLTLISPSSGFGRVAAGAAGSGGGGVAVRSAPAAATVNPGGARRR